MTQSRLPIGIQDFRTIREEDFRYVDKTALVRQLVEEGHHYFLSRPRRFGKSLLVDTLQSLFAGHEPLFRGLDIHPHWDWSRVHPVVRLSLDGSYRKPGDIESHLLHQLEVIERGAGLDPEPGDGTGPQRLRLALYRLHRAAGRRVVVLVDEYDKPILDMLHDPELAAANRDYLLGFYGIVKGSAEHVHFTFVTGVSMLSMGGVFGGFNHLLDISLDRRYATICGFRDEDLDRVFGSELAGLDREKIRTRYHGYQWRIGNPVYNPWDVLLLLDRREFRPFWFETGSPDFLFRMLMQASVSPMELEGRLADRSAVSRFDVDDIDIEALLFQTGYLTIAGEERDSFHHLYRLDYPNLEVRTSLNRGLLASLETKCSEPLEWGREFCALLEANDFAGFGERLRAWLTGIPYQWHSKDDLERCEAWHAGLLYTCLRAVGVDLDVEPVSHHGHANLAVRLGGQIFVLQFRMAVSDKDGAAALDAALAQMREQSHGERYRDHDGPIHLIGVACGHGARNLLEIRGESAGSGSGTF